MCRSICGISLILAVPLAFGQVAGISPEIHPDRTVTFRLRAPKATEAAVYCDWIQGRMLAMSKDPNGLWSVTTGPVDATVHVYLIHGSGDVPDGWTSAGAANLILDNLIAAGKARRMIVVMPAGHAALPGPGPYIDNSERFDRYLTKEVMPFIESEYRVAPGARNRALAGLSMGAGLTLTTGLSHEDLFSALGMFSASVLNPLVATYKAVLDDPKGTNARLPIIWSGCGDKDPQCSNMKQFTDLLQEHGIHATLRVIPDGAHAWPVWRLCLSEFVPLLFTGK